MQGKKEESIKRKENLSSFPKYISHLRIGNHIYIPTEKKAGGSIHKQKFQQQSLELDIHSLSQQLKL